MLDRYIRMLLIKLSPRYAISITTTTRYEPADGRFISSFTLHGKNRLTGERRTSKHYGKRELISELMLWQAD